MFLHVIDAKYIGDHRVHVAFNDGTAGEVDFSGSLKGSVFQPLRDVEYFRQMAIVGDTPFLAKRRGFRSGVPARLGNGSRGRPKYVKHGEDSKNFWKNHL